jgi:cytidylate kinase
MIITIDGPTASGKTTIARLLAKKLGYYYLSSGLLFRGLAYVLVHDFFYTPDQLKNPREGDIAKALDLNNLVYSYDAQQGEQLIVNGKNITSELRSPAISQYSSIIGTNAMIRTALAAAQHRIADHYDLVAEGRDMGSVIFPNAQIKFFLTASVDVRAERWQKDQIAQGKKISLEEARGQIKIRDERDINRVLAPLCVPDGAIIIDDSAYNQQQVLEKMMHYVKKN